MKAGIVNTRPFGEIAEFRNGINFSESSRGSGELAVIGVGAFQSNERISNFAHLERIARPKNVGDDALLRTGDLVFVRSNGNKALIGRCMKVENVQEPLTHSGFTIRARVKPNTVDPEWIAQFFATGLASRAIARRGGGTNISNLSQGVLQGLDIPIPTGSYQKAVLAISAQMTRYIRELSNLIEKKHELKRGLAQQLLSGGKRFPRFESKEWHEVELGKVFNERTEIYREDLTLLSVTNDRGVIPRDELDKRDTSNPDKSKYKRVAIGDIAYNTMRMWQGVSALSSLEGIVSPAYTVVVPTRRIDGAFAKHLFKFPPVVHMFHRHSQGLVDDTLNLKYNRFAKIRLRMPVEVQEQKQIAAILDLCESDLKLLVEMREQFELYKRGLLSRLLSGEVPVPA